MDIECPEQLLEYLRGEGHIAADEQPAMRTLAGGVSNRTVLIERSEGPDWVLKQALAKLRVEVDWYSDPKRIHREALGMRWLERLAPPGCVTPLVFEDREHHVLAMEAVPEPHRTWKTMLLKGHLSDEHVRRFGAILGTIHRRAFEQQEGIATAFEDRSFFESLRLEPYYAYTARQEPCAAGFLHDLIDTTRRHRLTLVHGDYSPKNILVRDDHLVLLDHEVIHFGDPAFDLGFSLTHLLSKAHHLPSYRNAFARATLHYWKSYAQHLGRVPWRERLEARAVRHTLGCLLARVAGRSKLEYLDATEQRHQREAVLALIPHPPKTIQALARAFLQALH